MVAGRSRGAQLILVATAMTGLAVMDLEARVCDRAGEPPPETRASDPVPNPNHHQPWPRVSVPHPAARRVLTQALDAAAVRLESAACREVLTDFDAFTERNLTDTLVSLGVSIQRYLTMVVFIDDSRHRRCLGGVLAFTTPGSRVVRVCGDELRRTSPHSDYIVAVVIHEILHTLGLGETPPSSMEITKRVLARCGSTR